MSSFYHSLSPLIMFLVKLNKAYKQTVIWIITDVFQLISIEIIKVLNITGQNESCDYTE